MPPWHSVLPNNMPYLQPGDILVDAGNSYYKDTERRIKHYSEKGISFFGIGVSGGEKGALLGPSIMGVVAPGGAMPSEPCISAAVAVSAAVIGNLEPEAAVAIAVPVGLLGSYLYQLRFFLNTFAIQKMDQYAVSAESGKLAFWIGGVPVIISFVLFVPLMFIALYLGAPVISDFMPRESSVSR